MGWRLTSLSSRQRPGSTPPWIPAFAGMTKGIASAGVPPHLAFRRGGPDARGPIALLGGLLLRQGDRDLVEVRGVLEDQLVEGGLAERRLAGGVAHRPGMRPWAVETGEVAGPQEIAVSHFRHATEAALFLDLEGEEDVALHDFARHARQRDVGLENPVLRSAELVLAVKPPEHEGDPADAGLFEDKAHALMAVADAGKDDRAHQLG